MKQHKIIVKGYEMIIEQDDDGKFIIPEQFRGQGTGLKPAVEVWILCRKPLSEKTVADNVLKWGTGGINIDISRISHNEDLSVERYGHKLDTNEQDWGFKAVSRGNEGRFPTNFIHDGSDEVMEEFDKAGVRTSGGRKFHHNVGKTGNPGKMANHGIYGEYNARPYQTESEIEKGSAARFFYCSKASSSERNEGLEGMEEKQIGSNKGHGLMRICLDCGASMLKPETCSCEKPNWGLPNKKNHHPTVKPTKLMTYLINMITPPNGIVIDPFMGSGSTGVAAIKAGYKFIGIEKEKEYMEIAKKRIEFNE